MSVTDETKSASIVFTSVQIACYCVNMGKSLRKTGQKTEISNLLTAASESGQRKGKRYNWKADRHLMQKTIELAEMAHSVARKLLQREKT